MSARVVAEKSVLLVDFENIQDIDLSGVPPEMRVKIFIGKAQTKIPVALVRDAQGLGTRVEWIMIHGDGKNALDFHVAFYVGQELSHSPQTNCVILSKDKGFDPLVRHLVDKNHKCRRIENPKELLAPVRAARKTKKPKDLDKQLELKVADAPADANLARVIELLKKVEKARPRTRTALLQHIRSMFQKKLCQEDVDKLVAMLFECKLVSEGAKGLTYHI